jgi:hypothetical protein
LWRNSPGRKIPVSRLSSASPGISPSRDYNECRDFKPKGILSNILCHTPLLGTFPLALKRKSASIKDIAADVTESPINRPKWISGNRTTPFKQLRSDRLLAITNYVQYFYPNLLSYRTILGAGIFVSM